jgi:uncharacterized membrane protein
VPTVATLRDEAVWYAVNRATGRDIVAAGGVALILSALLPELGVSGTAYTVLMMLVLATACALVGLIALARVRRLRL